MLSPADARQATVDPGQHLSHLDTALDRYAGSLSRGRDRLDDALVEHCAPWTARDLTHHVGGIHRWVVQAVRDGHGRGQSDGGPAEGTDVEAWFSEGAAEMVDVLKAAPSTPAWTFAGRHEVAFWRRRQAHENVMHGWDLARALGLDEPAIDPGLADDGVAEVVDVFVPRRLDRGWLTLPDHALRLRALDTGGTWVVGPGEPVATVSGPASALLLAVWKRRAADGVGAGGTLTWEGDAAAGHAVLASHLTP